MEEYRLEEHICRSRFWWTFESCGRAAAQPEHEEFDLFTLNYFTNAQIVSHGIHITFKHH